MIVCSNKLGLRDAHTLHLVEVSFKSLEISLFLLRLSLYFLQEYVVCIWGVCWPCLLSLGLWFMCFSSCVYKLSGIATCSDWSEVQLFSATSFPGQVVCSTEAAQVSSPTWLICPPYPGTADLMSSPGKEAINHAYLTMYLVIPNKTCIAIFPAVPFCRRILKPWQIKALSLFR